MRLRACVLLVCVACLGVSVARVVSGEGPSGSRPIAIGSMPASPPQAKVDLSYIDSSFVAGVVARPKRAVGSRFGKGLIEGAFEGDEFQQLSAEFSKRFGVDIGDVKQLAVLFTEASMAASMRIELPKGSSDEAQNRVSQVNQMKQIALAFHNYHDVYGHFPPGNGKVSWRVHLLPFLEQSNLYEQFDLEEDWDSETNKALLGQIPDIFKSPNAKDGKTSIHVIAGEGGPFHEEELGIDNIIDGTSLTMLAVIAGEDKATEWTKPGGLTPQEDAWKTFGKIEGSMVTALMDGSVHEFSTELDADLISGMITHAGREIFDMNGIQSSVGYGPDPRANPTVIAHCEKAIDKKTAIATFSKGFGEAKKKRGNGKEYWDAGGYAIWFPDDKTIVTTQEELLPKLMSNRKTDSKLRQFITAKGDVDLLAVADTQAMPKLFAKMMENAPLPALTTVADVWVAVDVTSESAPLASSNLSTTNAGSASALQAVIGGGLAMFQQGLMQEVPPGMEPMAKTLSGLMKGRKIELKDKTLSYTVPKPKNYAATIERMKAEFQKLGKSIRAARRAARDVSKRNVMKQIGLSFHNHHDVYGSFGAADGSTGDRKSGLSWRVHLLPFLEQTNLYRQFKLDEPWDSKHNKELIAKMPDIFKVEGVTDEGKTSIHVFVGDNAMFGDGKTAPRFRDITDGTSNTILAVMAGPDKAEFWTKPGGIKFDKNNSTIEMLGNIGDTFIGLIGDGSVRNFSKDLDEETLRAFVTRSGGEVVQ